MGAKTEIEYADSTLNLMEGCNGCELWPSKVSTCYAMNMLSRNKTGVPYPTAPAIASPRLSSFLSLPKLDGTERKDKPWLNGFPRVTFLNDMGDQHTQSLDLMWMKGAIPLLLSKSGIYICITKRPRRSKEFWRNIGWVPKNFWLLTSVTTQRSAVRIAHLLEIKDENPDAIMGLSVEPLLERIDLSRFVDRLDWVIVGGESGRNSRHSRIEWFLEIVDLCQSRGVPVFVKQLGSGIASQIGLDEKGGNWEKFPRNLQVRKMPKWINNKPLYKLEALF